LSRDHPALGEEIVVEKALCWNAGGEVWAAATGTVDMPIPPPE